jgi:hypothetical protein
MKGHFKDFSFLAGILERFSYTDPSLHLSPNRWRPMATRAALPRIIFWRLTFGSLSIPKYLTIYLSLLTDPTSKYIV